MWIVLLFVAGASVGGGVARDVTDEEYTKFPRLFHLDDYISCLSQTAGLYCFGTFQLEQLHKPDPAFNLIKEYSQDPHHFDRTELHRGYCVSSRCPTLAAERNTSRRFELCVSHWGWRHSLRTKLSKLSYCRTAAQEYARTHSPDPPDVPQKIFLWVVMVLVTLNTLGTGYDLFIGDDTKKSPLLLLWSVRTNWQRLTARYEDGDPRLSALAPVQGIRVVLMVLVIATHSACIYDMLYLYNPRWVEQISRHPVLMIFLNGTSVVQVFVVLSNFLLAYNMLLYGKNNQLSFKLLPMLVLRRIARIAPVHLLVVGYAATWWVRASSGPMWPAAVGAESEACRDKFWTHVFFINNLVDPERICLIQTWFLAVDMQIYILSAALTLALVRVRSRRRALALAASLVAASSVLNGVLAYIYNWQSLMFFAYPRTLRTMYQGIPSFTKLYQSPSGSLPGSFVGIFCAFLHFEMQETGVKLSTYKWLNLPYNLAPVAMVGWMLSGYWLRQYTEPWFVATYVAVEKPVLSALGGLAIIGMVNGLEGWLYAVSSWRGWASAGRVSLAVLAVHWSAGLAAAAARPQPLAASLLNVVSDTIATGFFSYAIAVPLTLMVEMPVHRTITALL